MGPGQGCVSLFVLAFSHMRLSVLGSFPGDPGDKPCQTQQVHEEQPGQGVAWGHKLLPGEEHRGQYDSQKPVMRAFQACGSRQMQGVELWFPASINLMVSNPEAELCSDHWKYSGCVLRILSQSHSERKKSQYAIAIVSAGFPLRPA